MNNEESHMIYIKISGWQCQKLSTQPKPEGKMTGI